ncbi:hypothetical protein [Fibrella aquatilis]|uniref:Carboxypeptidase-like regulatory domain-containing protein n=1 Tax=Fibrella aquatilis TaxID=2817059 RepID=A0A939G4S2_9BACT|nr:hypothetical protein [Fibrella aquatilis]MBO0929778.1 hypothetical protein [Fibrella aquatilis]
MKLDKILILLVPFSQIAYAQQKCFQVVSKDNNQPVPYATATCTKCSYGSYSDENGYLCFDTSKTDTIIITSIGFIKLEVWVNDLRKDSIFYMIPQPVQLNEVKIKKRILRDQEVGPIKNRRFSLSSHSYCPNSAAQLGVFISNTIDDDCTISSLIYNTEVKKSDFVKAFKCKASVFSDDLQKPGKNLLCVEKVFDVLPEQRKIIVDVKECNVIFPKNGVWICIETIGYTDKNDTYYAIQQNSVGVSWGQNRMGNRRSQIKTVSPYYSLVTLKDGDIAKEKFWTLPWKDVSSIKYGKRVLEFGMEIVY